VASSRLADAVLTAEHTKGELLIAHGMPAAKVHVLLNLPDDSLFTPQFTLEDPFRGRSLTDVPEFRLIYHGTLAHRLGMDNAIGAMPRVLAAIPSARLQLFGDGDQLPELHAQAESLGIADRVHFSDGFVPIEQIIPDIRRAHLAVLPTRHEVSTDYMLPTKLLEYLAFGIPAVFTPTHTVRHYVGDEHPLFLTDPTPENTAAKILWVANNYAEAKRLTAELQDRWFSRFHWPVHRKVYLELLDELCGDAGGPSGSSSLR
jgi:glycosyltransferase involved in cell wall biosynthesis